jgi:hypothetical protein
MAEATMHRSDVLGDIFDRFDALEARLDDVRHLASVFADMSGVTVGTVQVDAEAISSTMAFFATELTAARDSVESIHSSIRQLNRGAALN